MVSFIPSDLCFQVLESQKTLKITKGNENQSTTNHLTGSLKENFIATDIALCLSLLLSPQWIICGSPRQKSHGGKNSPNHPHAASRTNALK